MAESQLSAKRPETVVPVMNAQRGQSLGLGEKLGARRCLACALDAAAAVEQRAAGFGPLVDEKRFRAGLGSRDGGLESCRACANDHNVGKQVFLVVVLVMRLGLEIAEARHGADGLLEIAPGAERAEEGLVIEAHRQEAREIAEHGVDVVIERAELVDGLDGDAVGQGMAVGADVGLVGHLHQRVGVVPGHGEHGTRTVILERARDEAATFGIKRGGDDVAGVAVVQRAVERECQRPGAVDEKAPASTLEAAGAITVPGSAHAAPSA